MKLKAIVNKDGKQIFPEYPGNSTFNTWQMPSGVTGDLEKPTAKNLNMAKKKGKNYGRQTVQAN